MSEQAKPLTMSEERMADLSTRIDAALAENAGNFNDPIDMACELYDALKESRSRLAECEKERDTAALVAQHSTKWEGEFARLRGVEFRRAESAESEAARLREALGKVKAKARKFNSPWSREIAAIAAAALSPASAQSERGRAE